MKIGPVMRACAAHSALSPRLLHTGQHYDEAMKDAFFRQLQIPAPDVDLGVGSGTHAFQTAEIMRRFEPVLDDVRPDVVLVVGDVNSTVACALVAAKKGVAVAHVEAGLRSYDRTMPEEINRVLTDQLSSRLYTTEQSAADNLAREGISSEHICFVGNVMIDTLLANRERAPEPQEVFVRHGVPRYAQPADGFGLVTLHRPSNVDDNAVLAALIGALATLAADLPLVFPVHPRTRARLESSGLWQQAAQHLILLPPLDYLQLLALMANSRLVLTDSGGIQEETTALGVPCLTLRDNTERPITIAEGTNTLVGRDPDLILATAASVLRDGGKSGRVPEFWDGRAAERIANDLGKWLPAVSAAAGKGG